jgi:hypothetical protein
VLEFIADGGQLVIERWILSFITAHAPSELKLLSRWSGRYASTAWFYLIVGFLQTCRRMWPFEATEVRLAEWLCFISRYDLDGKRGDPSTSPAAALA